MSFRLAPRFLSPIIAWREKNYFSPSRKQPLRRCPSIGLEARLYLSAMNITSGHVFCQMNPISGKRLRMWTLRPGPAAAAPQPAEPSALLASTGFCQIICS
jgi:hypothetical protein